MILHIENPKEPTHIQKTIRAIKRIMQKCRINVVFLYINKEKFKTTSFIRASKRIKYTLAGVVQWIGRRPANPKVAGSIPHQGTCLRLRARSLVGGTQEATN